MPATKTNVLEKFKLFSQRMKKADAEKTVWRPGRGTYRCALTGIAFAESKFNFFQNTPKAGSFDAAAVQFTYTISDTSSPENGTEWRGRFWVSPNVSDETITQVFGLEPPNDPEHKVDKGSGGGQWKRIQIQEGQFKGSVAVLLGMDPEEMDDVNAELALLEEDIEKRKIAGEDSIFVDVQVIEEESRQTKGEMIFRRERITRRAEHSV